MLQINAANNKQSFGVRRPFRFKDPRTESLFKYMFPKKEVDKINVRVINYEEKDQWIIKQKYDMAKNIK